MSKPFRRVEMNRPNRSAFPLNSFRIFDCDLGQLIPVFCRKMVPGDSFKISNELVIRANPLVAPLMHEINVFIHYFFVPFRLLWPKPDYEGTGAEIGSWEDFFTGGVDGTLEPVKPKWKPTLPAHVALHTLWDYFGFPIDVIPQGAYPDAWPLRAYNLVWNEYYRDQNYMNEVDLDDYDLKRRCWEKDYFTTALPWQQRGQAPALPITGVTSAVWSAENFAMSSDAAGSRINVGNPGGGVPFVFTGTSNPAWMREFFNANSVDLSNASTFDVNDLRLAFQTQKFLERNARAGGRYIEQLKAHYGVSPRDDRMQRPEYIGGMRTPVIVSEVLQTSQTTTGTEGSPQGNLAGHGMTVDQQYIANYYAPEFGVCIGIMSMMPRPVYQQGIDREWLGETRWDELLPEFVSLGEQPIYQAEIYANGSEVDNKKVFGFQGRYDEYRVAHNKVCGLLRKAAPDNLSFWHIARYFETAPALNEEFLTCNPQKDYLAVPSLPGWIVTCGTKVRAVRPLPLYGTPGLIDHH